MKRKLGHSDIEVSALGLGCMEIGGQMRDKEGHRREKTEPGQEPMFFLGEVDDAQSIRTLEYALDAGVNFFDTAPAYGAGHSERILGRAFAGKREKVVIATKFGKPIDEKENWFGRYPNRKELIKNIRSECEASLKRLGTDYIDLYQYHQLEFNLLEYADQVIEILERLVAEGKIRYYGWSTTGDLQCIRVFAQGDHYTATQHYFNVVSDAPEILAVCDEFKQASIARGPLAGGFLTGKYTADNVASLLSENDFRHRLQKRQRTVFGKLDAIREILTANGRTLAQGALAWIWARSDRTIPIPGFRTLAQVEQNIQALDFGPLTSEQMAQIDVLLERNPAN